MNKVCVLLTGIAKKMKQSKDEGQAFVAGMDADEKLHLTCVVIGVSGATNRHQMGILVNACETRMKKPNSWPSESVST